MKQNANSRRLAQAAREKLGYILLFEVSDPALELVTLTGCEVSIDKSLLRAYISCEASRYDKVTDALARAKGRIRSILGRSLGWRVTPDIAFVIDTTADEAERIARALEDVPATLGVEKDEFGYPIKADFGEAEEDTGEEAAEPAEAMEAEGGEVAEPDELAEPAEAMEADEAMEAEDAGADEPDEADGEDEDDAV